MVKKCNNVEGNNFVEGALGRHIDVFNKIKKDKIFQDQSFYCAEMAVVQLKLNILPQN